MITWIKYGSIVLFAVGLLSISYSAGVDNGRVSMLKELQTIQDKHIQEIINKHQVDHQALINQMELYRQKVISYSKALELNNQDKERLEDDLRDSNKKLNEALSNEKSSNWGRVDLPPAIAEWLLKLKP